jgi:outer membrane receptor protein involved in Fe transport
MKRIFTLIILFCAALSANAQFGVGGGGGSTIVGKISGTVVDSITKKPLDYATVSLFRSGGKAPITGALTDEKGNFKLNNVKAGNYKVTISFIGYPTKTIDPVVTTPAKPDKNMGNVILSSGSRNLKEVTVTGSTPIIENRIDKIVYNAEKDITAAGGVATDVLQKVPLVSVDLNGNVSLRGDANVRVLINGKPSGATASSLSDVLKGIPADQIKSVEVITSPSAKYDAEGSAGIINIITKQKNFSGVSGSVTGGVGTRQNNGNLNFNYNKNRFNFTANVGGNASWPQTSTTSLNQRIDNDFTDPATGAVSSVHTSTVQNGTSRVSRHAVTGSLSAGYEFNSYNSINTSLRFTQIEFNTNSTTSNITNLNTLAATPVFRNYTLNSDAHAVPASGFDWNVNYIHKTKKEGEELDLSAQWSRNTGTTNYANYYTGVFPNLKNEIDGISNEYTLQLDYTLPISKILKLEAGGKSIFRRINTSNDLYDYSNSMFVYNPLTSNTYDYNQDVYAGYSVFTITLPKKYSVLAGLRDENTSIHGDPKSLSQTDLQAFNQNYNTLIPSLTIQKEFSATKILKVAYSKRITRPSLQFLNPFVNQSNPQALSTGNPELSPEISQTVELDYNTYIGSNILNLSTYYKRTSNLIENITAPNPAATNGGTLTTYQNIGTNNSIGANIFGTVNPFKALTIIANVNAYTYKPDPSGVFNLAQSQNGTYLQYFGFLRATLELPKNFVAEAFAFGSSSRRTIQGTNPSFSLFGIGAKKQFMQKKLALGVNALQPFSNYKEFNSTTNSNGISQSTSFRLPFRSFGLTFSYNFGKVSFGGQQQKKGINNDDLKQGDQGGGAPSGNPAGGNGGR